MSKKSIELVGQLKVTDMVSHSDKIIQLGIHIDDRDGLIDKDYFDKWARAQSGVRKFRVTIEPNNE